MRNFGASLPMMNKRMLAAIIAVATVTSACSNDDDKAAKQKECDSIAADIADKAVNVYHVPAEGACNNPSIAEPFAAACAKLSQCRQELAAM